MKIASRVLLVVLSAVWIGALATAQDRPIPRPSPDHPGNVFLEGEDVTIPLGPPPIKPWRALDLDGKVIAKSDAGNESTARLGRLSTGWYEIVFDGAPNRIWLAVLKPLAAPTPRTSPIAADVAMAWFYKDKQRSQVASLCALAGLNWVRDRLSWGEVEKSRGQFASDTRYDDTARAQSAAGLRVLQVNHSSAAWTKAETHKRFPPDLRDAHNFYREMAKRWKGQVQAIEPWNEADIPMFGGHTGAEMASLQKASYWGIRAGNPDAIVCLNVLAHYRASTLQDLADNQAHAYFDTCNFHHYAPVAKLPAWYECFRKINFGKPLWVTECSMPVQWSGDETAKELSDESLRVQARRVAMPFASSIHEGSSATCFFLIPHYVEGKTQFGLLKKDLTPRPAYVALAACGRLLADAIAAGKLKNTPASVYAFDARPDGQSARVIVAWTDKDTQTIQLPVPATVVFDHLGRPIAQNVSQVTVGVSPIFAILPPGTKLDCVAPPKNSSSPETPIVPSRIVLQTVWPANGTSVNDSAYKLLAGPEQSIPLFVYNFGTEPARGKLAVTGPADWTISLPNDLQVDPMGRVELKLTTKPAGEGKVQSIRIAGEFGKSGQSVLSIRVLPVR